jgi:hypothetical protein
MPVAACAFGVKTKKELSRKEAIAKRMKMCLKLECNLCI